MKQGIMFFTVFLLLLCGCRKTQVNASTENFNRFNLPALESFPVLPFLLVNPTPQIVTAGTLQDAISKHAQVEWLAEDQNYFLPTKANMDIIIQYLDAVYRKFGINYIPEGLDCDDFARSKTAFSKLILAKAYQIEASAAVFTIFVFQKKAWASVPAGGGHALVAFACSDENGERKVFIWEPQSTEVIAATGYPNKDQLFYIGDEKTVAPATNKAK